MGKIMKVIGPLNRKLRQRLMKAGEERWEPSSERKKSPTNEIKSIFKVKINKGIVLTEKTKVWRNKRQ